MFVLHLANTFQLHLVAVDEIFLEVNKMEDRTTEPVTPNDVLNEIKKNVSSKKAPGYDLITGPVLEEIQIK